MASLKGFASKRAWLKIAADAAVVALSFMVAISVRFEFVIPRQYMTNFIIVLPGVVALYLLANFLMHLYAGRWRFASFEELLNLSSAAIISTAVLFLALLLVPGARDYVPISVGVMGGVLALFAMAFLRLQYRMLEEWKLEKAGGGSIRVLLVGAGEAGDMVARDILRHPELDLDPVGFADDDPAKRNLVLHGVPVLGTSADIPRLARDRRIDEIYLTMPSATGERIRAILPYCEETGARIKVLPGIYTAVAGEVGVAAVRELRLEDLLGREPVQTDIASISAYTEGKTVLITGAGGSIGSELARQLCHVGPGRLVMLDNDETALYDMELEMAAHTGACPGVVVVADIRDPGRLDDVFERFKPQVVFHSAALKHVPMMELNPSEAVKTNVLGTRNVAEQAVRHRVERFILISTDKAVEPTSVMGATKRVAELLMKSMNSQNGTLFSAVRFGNVLGSRGSVVPVFQKQIEDSGPVLVTHPDIERYFMTIEEAAQLVIQAGAFTEGGGDLFILDMGESVRIMDLAQQMVRMLGNGKDIEIKVTGLRPGEKMQETLVFEVEETLPTRHPKINRVVHEYELPQDFEEQVNGLFDNAVQDDGTEIVARLSRLLPSYQPNDERPEANSEKPGDEAPVLKLVKDNLTP